MTRILPGLALVLSLLAGCGPLTQANRFYTDDLLNGIGALNGMPDDAGRAPLAGPGWEGVY